MPSSVHLNSRGKKSSGDHTVTQESMKVYHGRDLKIACIASHTATCLAHWVWSLVGDDVSILTAANEPHQTFIFHLWTRPHLLWQLLIKHGPQQTTGVSRGFITPRSCPFKVWVTCLCKHVTPRVPGNFSLVYIFPFEVELCCACLILLVELMLIQFRIGWSGLGNTTDARSCIVCTST